MSCSSNLADVVISDEVVVQHEDMKEGTFWIENGEGDIFFPHRVKP